MKETQDHRIDNENEESEGEDDERESENLEDGTYERIEQSEDYSRNEIQFYASCGNYRFGQEIADSVEDEPVEEDRKEYFHKRVFSEVKSGCKYIQGEVNAIVLSFSIDVVEFAHE